MTRTTASRTADSGKKRGKSKSGKKARTPAGVGDKIAQGAEQVKHSAAAAAGTLIEGGKMLVEQQRHHAAGVVDQCAAAFDTAAASMQEDDQTVGERSAKAIAQRIHDAADYLRKRKTDRIIEDVKQTVKQSPELVVGGLVVAGLAATHYLRTSRNGTKNDK